MLCGQRLCVHKVCTVLNLITEHTVRPLLNPLIPVGFLVGVCVLLLLSLLCEGQLESRDLTKLKNPQQLKGIRWHCLLKKLGYLAFQNVTIVNKSLCSQLRKALAADFADTSPESRDQRKNCSISALKKTFTAFRTGHWAQTSHKAKKNQPSGYFNWWPTTCSEALQLLLNSICKDKALPLVDPLMVLKLETSTGINAAQLIDFEVIWPSHSLLGSASISFSLCEPCT